MEKKGVIRGRNELKEGCKTKILNEYGRIRGSIKGRRENGNGNWRRVRRRREGQKG